MRVVSIDGDVQQDFEVGDIIANIDSTPLAELEAEVCEEAFGANFGDGRPITIDPRAELRAPLPFIPTGFIDDILCFGENNDVEVETARNILRIIGCSSALQYCKEEA